METLVWAASLLSDRGTAAAGALGLVAAGAGVGDWGAAGGVGAGLSTVQYLVFLQIRHIEGDGFDSTVQYSTVQYSTVQALYT